MTVVTPLVGLLADADLRVRMAATDTLRHVARRGDPQTIALAVHHLGHPSPGVREAALITLQQLGSGDGEAVLAIAQYMGEADVEGRKALLFALQQRLGSSSCGLGRQVGAARWSVGP